jgi:hypothetical protein
LSKINIHILPSSAIDALKWNEKIRQEQNGLIYSTTSYLNTLTDGWVGLVVNDYETIIAIPIRKKCFITYCYSPAFIQQLGIIGKFNTEDAGNIIRTIKNKYKYGSLQFNFLNNFSSIAENGAEKINYIIDLNRPFKDIAKKFRKDLKVSLEKCKYELFDYIKNIDIKTAIEMYQNHYGSRLHNMTNKDYKNLFSYCNLNINNRANCFTRSIVNEKNDILAIALLIKDEKRLYNIANTVSTKGREIHANHFLLSKIIEEFSEQQLIFDFEGSTIPGVKEFYTAFCPEEETYFTHQFNKLPFPLSHLA